MKPIQKLADKNKYLVLLVSFLLILIVPALPHEAQTRSVLSSGLLLINVFGGLLIIYHQKNLFAQLMKVLIFGTFIGQGLIFAGFTTWIPVSVLYLAYFFLISFRVYQDIYKTKDVDLEMLTAVVCGFILLGLIGSFAFTIVDLIKPGSFAGIPENSEFELYVYYSFISILTIGYGDISPQTDVARSVTIVIGIIGYVYTVMITGITIGKFLNRRS